MAITDKQVNFKFSNVGASASDTTSNGDIIFDKKNKKIYARGAEFDCSGSSTYSAFANVYSSGIQDNVSLTGLGNILIITENNKDEYLTSSLQILDSFDYDFESEIVSNKYIELEKKWLDLTNYPEVECVIFDDSLTNTNISIKLPSFHYSSALSRLNPLDEDVTEFILTSKYASMREMVANLNHFDESVYTQNNHSNRLISIPVIIKNASKVNIDVYYFGFDNISWLHTISNSDFSMNSQIQNPKCQVVRVANSETRVFVMNRTIPTLDISTGFYDNSTGVNMYIQENNEYGNPGPSCVWSLRDDIQVYDSMLLGSRRFQKAVSEKLDSGEI